MAAGSDAERYASTLARCDEKLAKSFARQEEVAGRRSASCPTDGDAAGIAFDLGQVSRRLSASLAGRPRFEDNGDGTVTDHDADIMWEQKVALDGITNPNDLHDADNLYRWAGPVRWQPTLDANRMLLPPRPASPESRATPPAATYVAPAKGSAS